MAKSDAEFRTILEKYGLTPPPETILDVIWCACGDDWYVKTEISWFWWESRQREWKGMMYDPSC